MPSSAVRDCALRIMRSVGLSLGFLDCQYVDDPAVAMPRVTRRIQEVLDALSPAYIAIPWDCVMEIMCASAMQSCDYEKFGDAQHGSHMRTCLTARVQESYKTAWRNGMPLAFASYQKSPPSISPLKPQRSTITLPRSGGSVALPRT